MCVKNDESAGQGVRMLWSQFCRSCLHRLYFQVFRRPPLIPVRVDVRLARLVFNSFVPLAVKVRQIFLPRPPTSMIVIGKTLFNGAPVLIIQYSSESSPLIKKKLASLILGSSELLEECCDSFIVFCKMLTIFIAVSSIISGSGISPGIANLTASRQLRAVKAIII
jgi:hypothetical protein